MITASIILDTRRKTKKGFPVKIRITKKNSRYISLKIYQKSEKLKITPEIKHRQLKLIQEVNFCNQNRLNLDDSLKVISEGLKTEVEVFVLEKKIEKLKQNSKIGILEFFDIYIEEKEQKGQSVDFFIEIKKYVKDYIIEDEPINNIDYEWINGFKLFKKNAPAGINSYLKAIRAVYKEAQRRPSLGVKSDNPFLGTIKKTVKKEIVEITIADLKKLKEPYIFKKGTSEINKFKIQQKIDLWLFQFLIGGHDLADIANLKKENVKNGRIKFKRYKNRNRPGGGEIVNNKLTKRALEILKKYPSKTDKLFDFVPLPNTQKYIDFRGNYNRTLKNISENLKLTSVIKSKTPRYVFRSLAGEMMLDVLVIMQLQGHTPTGVTFAYQRKLPNKIIDKQLKKIINKIW